MITLRRQHNTQHKNPISLDDDDPHDGKHDIFKPQERPTAVRCSIKHKTTTNVLLLLLLFRFIKRRLVMCLCCFDDDCSRGGGGEEKLLPIIRP